MENLGQRPLNIKVGLWQCSPVSPRRYPDGTSTMSTEFCNSTGDTYAKTAAYNDNGTVSRNLEELDVPYQPTRSIRSESDSLITVPKMQGVIYGNRCFGKAAATLWNDFPLTIRKYNILSTFKKRVKTNLFLAACSS